MRTLKVLIVGGTGVISRSIVGQLLGQNHEVTLFNRGNKQMSFHKEVKQIVGDRSQREEFERNMRREQFDVVIDMICFNEEDAQSTIRAFRDNVEQIIVTSSVAAYKRPYRTIPAVEESEELYDNPEFGYAFHKAEAERYLHKVIQEENLPITIIRPSLTYGPGAANLGVLRQNYGVIDRIRKGKPLVMFGDGTNPWSFTFVPDLAKGYASVAGNKKTYGKAYHITSEEQHIWEDLYLEFGKIIGIEPEICYIPSELLYKAAPNLCGHLYFEKMHAGLFDNSKIKQDVEGLTMDISLHQGLKMMLEWFESEANDVDPEKDELEDRLVDLYHQWAAAISNMYLK